jgi:hypothetical protein
MSFFLMQAGFQESYYMVFLMFSLTISHYKITFLFCSAGKYKTVGSRPPLDNNCKYPVIYPLKVIYLLYNGKL